MSGFAERNASKFQSLFDFIGTGLRNLTPREASDTAGTAPSRTGRQSFKDGGIVPGPTGAAVNATVHGGEMILNQGQQTSIMRMLAPVIPTQNLLCVQILTSLRAYRSSAKDCLHLLY
jgi:hypothetical protein